MQDDPSLEAAYALQTPEDSVRLYRDWAATYDADFISASGYILADVVAEAFLKAGGRGPVLDVGAGTGRVGVGLKAAGIQPIDAIDISPDMLNVARETGAYRACVAANVLEPLDLPHLPFNGIVSAGTFTLGHVGPDALEHLLAVAAPEALFAISIRDAFYAEADFEDAFKRLEASGKIAARHQTLSRIYKEAPASEHNEDRAWIVTFNAR